MNPFARGVCDRACLLTRLSLVQRTEEACQVLKLTVNVSRSTGYLCPMFSESELAITIGTIL